MDFTVKQPTYGGQPIEKNKKKRANLDIKWQCKIYYDDYTKRLDNAIQEAIDILDSTNSGVTKEEIASRANRVISKSLVNCSSKAFHELASKPKDRKRSRRRIKRQNWWDNELELLFIRVRIAYSAFKDSGWDKSLKDTYTKAKSDFRARKRYNQKLKRSQTYRLIEDLFKSNRVDFWKKIKRLERDVNSINIDLDKIKAEYEKIFTTSNRCSEEEKKDEEKVSEFLAGYSNSTFDTRTDPLSIRLMLDALSLGKSIGVRGVSHEMLKFNGSQKLVEAMAKLFDFMVNNQVCPEVFNVSIIKPLIKDSCKPNDDINNIRPVAVSDAIANLYERFLLIKVKANHQDADQQFGFKVPVVVITPLSCLKSPPELSRVGAKDCMHVPSMLVRHLTKCRDRNSGRK